MPSQTSSLSRKEREFIAREELILKHARRLLLEKGFQAWNMEQLAEAVEYSKGTLYQHFSSKEDLVLGVATQSLRQRADLFEQAATFQGRTRERCRAIGFACCEFAMAHPDYFHTDMLLKSSSFVEKASQERREAHAFEGMRCWRAINTIIIEAMALKKVKPVASVFDCRMINSFPTSRQPMRGFVDRIMAMEGKDGILSISVAHCTASRFRSKV